MEKAAARAVKDGSLPEEIIDESVRRILKLVFRANEVLKSDHTCDYAKHHDIARKAAEQGAVLLKNEEGILPLNHTQRLAVIGSMAKNIRYQGAGSSHINPKHLSQPLDYIKDAEFAMGCDEHGDTDDAMIDAAVKAAENADAAIVFAGLPDRFESEGFDRDNMKLPQGHIRMIEEVARANKNTVVVLLAGCVVECDWADSVKAILYMGLPGQAGGEAIAKLLYGEANPCGKLAETWWSSYEDVPSSEIYGKTKDALYEEGIYIGYRYCEKAGKNVRFPFGYGLSYTNFSYSDLEVKDNIVNVKVTNTGNMTGAEIVQMYITAPKKGIHRPLRELKGFKKVWLTPGESADVSFKLNERSFAIWDDGWKIQEGAYTICVGALTAQIDVNGTNIPVKDWQSNSFYESCNGKPKRREWEAMSGITYTPEKLIKGQFTMDHSVEEMKDFSLIMKIMYKAVEKTVAKGFGGKADYENPDFRMMMASSAGSPLRSMQISGGMKGGIMSGLLEMANGHYFRGIGRMIKGE